MPLNQRIDNQLRTSMPDLSPGQAWQSSHNLHLAEGLEPLTSSIHTFCGSVLEFLRVDYREVDITACWATVNAPGRGHMVHTHPNSFLSGVYYAATRAGADTINFHDPRSQTGIMRPPVTELTASNADQAVIEVAEGTLLLFPSWLPHSVDCNSSNANRVSVSFNLMFSAYSERLCQPLWGDA